jgi:thiol-disulfide isomerase/thioredoxin
MKFRHLSIKKYVFLLLFSVTLCSIAQNEVTPDDKSYTGIITQEDFRTGSTQKWFERGYDAYEAEDAVLKGIKKSIKKYKIKIFMGTWCSDSRREVPKFLKLLDEVKFKDKNLEVYAMDKSKTTEANHEKGLNVHHVPTIIFFDKKGNEVNRFVEFPQESLEEDILKIVTKQSYQNPYAE